ncbi:MAG: hypothetical protein Fur0037_04790 [Planctomycetota bacterium]
MQPLLGTPDARNRKGQAIATEMGYLWANLMRRGCGKDLMRIGFCSIGEGEGASATAANLALFLGARGTRVVLVEASLRTPEMAEVFRTTATPGLAECLRGSAPLPDVVRRQVAPGVDLVPAGETGDSFWAFCGGRFEAIVGDLASDLALCLAVLPPLTQAPEAGIAAASLDGVVLVVGADRHRRDVVLRNVEFLRSIAPRFLGAILTDLAYPIPGPVARML